jgi:hypothetical protein
MAIYYNPDSNEISTRAAENRKTPLKRARDRVAWFRQVDWIKASRSLTKTEFNSLRMEAEAAARDVAIQYCLANGIDISDAELAADTGRSKFMPRPHSL